MLRILVVSAFPEERHEIDALFPDAEEHLVAEIDQKNILKSEYNGMQIYFSYLGVGASLAAANTAKLCSQVNPDLIIFCGVAGGVQSVSQKHGDVLVATALHHKDFDHFPSIFVEETPYHQCVFDPHTTKANKYQFEIDPDLLYCLQKLHPAHLFGAIATSNFFPAPPGKYPEVLKSCVAVEMEGAAVVEAATCPVIILRSLSNLLDHEGSNLGEPAGIILECSKNLASVLKTLLDSPELPSALKLAQIRFLKQFLNLESHPESGSEIHL